jgi:hypothetical protein
MSTERLFADILQELCDGKKTGALYVRIAEASEDLYRIFFVNGDIFHIRYGSAAGKDCLDIIEFYNLQGATYFEGVQPPVTERANIPETKEIISLFRRLNKKITAK